MANRKYHYFYKITNNINNHFYYGVHNTDNLDDGYMGSGTRLHLAYKKYGIENFTKEILKFFDTREEALKHEAEIVNEELVNDKNCYNLSLGGYGGVKDTYISPCINKVLVKYRNTEKYFYINTEDYNSAIHDTTWTNRHHTEYSKDKIRKTMTPKDSTNDRVWVNKDGIVKYLRKDLLESYLEDGWKLGRTGYKPRKNGQGKIIKE